MKKIRKIIGSMLLLISFTIIIYNFIELYQTFGIYDKVAGVEQGYNTIMYFNLFESFFIIFLLLFMNSSMQFINNSENGRNKQISVGPDSNINKLLKEIKSAKKQNENDVEDSKAAILWMILALACLAWLLVHYNIFYHPSTLEKFAFFNNTIILFISFICGVFGFALMSGLLNLKLFKSHNIKQEA